MLLEIVCRRWENGNNKYNFLQTLIPYKNDVESKSDSKKMTDSYKQVSNDNRELKEVRFIFEFCFDYVRAILNEYIDVLYCF